MKDRLNSLMEAHQLRGWSPLVPVQFPMTSKCYLDSTSGFGCGCRSAGERGSPEKKCCCVIVIVMVSSSNKVDTFNSRCFGISLVILSGGQTRAALRKQRAIVSCTGFPTAGLSMAPEQANH